MKNIRAQIHDPASLPESACAYGCTVSDKHSGFNPWPCFSARICMCLRMHWKWKNVRAKIHDAACLPESACAFGCTVSTKLSGSHPWPCISARICMCLRMHCKWKTFGLQSMTLHVTASPESACAYGCTVSEKRLTSIHDPACHNSVCQNLHALMDALWVKNVWASIHDPACHSSAKICMRLWMHCKWKTLGSTPWPSANTVTQSS